MTQSVKLNFILGAPCSRRLPLWLTFHIYIVERHGGSKDPTNSFVTFCLSCEGNVPGGDGDGSVGPRCVEWPRSCSVLFLVCFAISTHSYISQISSATSADLTQTAQTLLSQNRIQTLATMTATSVNTDPKSPDYSVPFKIEGRNFRHVAATKADAPVFADVFWDSFQEDAVFRAMNGAADPEKVVENSKKAWTEGWDAKGNACFKVVDEDNG